MSIQAIREMVTKVMASVRTKVQRGTIARTNPGGRIQTLQIRLLNGELRDKVEYFQHYGFASRPFPDGEHVATKLASAEHMIVLATEDRRYRFILQEDGELALYTDEGDFIHFKRGKKIEIATDDLEINAGGSSLKLSAAGIDINSAGPLTFSAPSVEFSGP